MTGTMRDARAALAAAFSPVAFAASYVLNAWVQSGTSPHAIGRALLLAIIAAIAITLIARLIVGDARRASIAASVTVAFVILSRNAFLVAANAATLVPIWLGAVMVIAIAALITLVVVSWRRAGRRLPGIDAWLRGLNVASTALLIVVLAPAVSGGLMPAAIEDLQQQGVPLDAAPDRSAVRRHGPDVYLVLLDGYPRADVLADQFGFDNRPFLNDLEDRGFQVASSSHSNYTLTEFTLLSMFHMALLEDIPQLEPVLAGDVPPQPTSRVLLNDNPTIEAFRERDYLVVGFSGTYEDVALRRADVFVQLPQLNEVEWELLANTYLLDALALVSPEYVADEQRSLIDGAFDAAETLAERRDLGPRFVMAHVFAPRSPLVFGPSGERRPIRVLRRTEDTAAAAGLSSTEFTVRLGDQVRYVNDRTTALVDAILATSPQPPVIIVMSDHGSRSRALDPEEADDDLLRERFGTLFAAYTPGRTSVFPDDVTPAEVTGRLFDAYFGMPFVAPGDGIFASEDDHYRLVRLGDAPPMPAP